MKSRFQQQMIRLTGTPTEYRYLLAVSGGADSMVMADLFVESGYHFAIAHCNFHLRGEDSDRDMRFVQQWSEKQNVVCFVKEFDTLAETEASGESVEMTARRLRYQWFEEVGKDYDYVVTAHQADDQAETMFLNLTRGTGLKGLTGITEKSDKLLRPLLSFTADEIRQYAKDQNIEYVIDVTNADEQIRRNKIRHTVIPALESMNPQLVPTMCHTSRILQQQYGIYQDAVKKFMDECTTRKGDTLHIRRAFLDNHPYKETLLFEILKTYHFTEAAVQCILKAEQPGRMFYAPQYVLLVDREEYLVYPIEKPEEVEIVCHDLDELRQFFDVERLVIDGTSSFPKDRDTLVVAPSKLQFPITLRHWKEGDFFYPFGAAGRKKLSDFFTDQKFNRREKDEVILFCIHNHIAWVIGYRSDERFKLIPTDIEFYTISIKDLSFFHLQKS
ncbi:MAG: tRNA lysidine(34) synthetase TilS [Bacteroidales bacterium]|nr:tRNA lysidine(34) synthetase TilS [Bacteroidales bacterium]